MPEQQTIERAREDEREGKSPSTQAGEFVREEMEHIREGKHGALGQASDRHRAFESAARWCEVATAKIGIAANAQTGEARLENGTQFAPKNVQQTFARGEKGAQARAAFSRVTSRAVAASAFRGTASHESKSVTRSEKGGRDTQTPAALTNGFGETKSRSPQEHQESGGGGEKKENDRAFAKEDSNRAR
jgi:hypothetical protein